MGHPKEKRGHPLTETARCWRRHLLIRRSLVVGTIAILVPYIGWRIFRFLDGSAREFFADSGIGTYFGVVGSGTVAALVVFWAIGRLLISERVYDGTQRMRRPLNRIPFIGALFGKILPALFDWARKTGGFRGRVPVLAPEIGIASWPRIAWVVNIVDLPEDYLPDMFPEHRALILVFPRGQDPKLVPPGPHILVLKNPPGAIIRFLVSSGLISPKRFERMTRQQSKSDYMPWSEWEKTHANAFGRMTDAS